MQEIQKLNQDPAWCQECYNLVTLEIIKESIERLRLDTDEFVLVTGIGHSAKLSHYLNCNVLNAPPGKALASALGIKMANHHLQVIVISGDGDILSNGLSTLIHASRRNINVTTIILNNMIQCTSKGYPSPTTPRKYHELFPDVQIWEELSIAKLCIAANCSFVARGATARREQLQELILKGLDHKGFTVLEILEPCTNYFDLETIADLNSRMYLIEDENDAEPDNLEMSCQLANTKDRIPLGLIYRDFRMTWSTSYRNLYDDALVNQLISRKKLDKFLQKFLKP